MYGLHALEGGGSPLPIRVWRLRAVCLPVRLPGGRAGWPVPCLGAGRLLVDSCISLADCAISPPLARSLARRALFLSLSLAP